MAEARQPCLTRLGWTAPDGEELAVRSNGGDWVIAWHPPIEAPPGRPHGANAFCVAEDNRVVLIISPDGTRWGWPGGRPEPGESWEQTLHREIPEETCATVIAARLLGFVRAECRSGPERGRVLVRSIWRADVDPGPWRPKHEVPHRRVVPASRLHQHLSMEVGFEPIYAHDGATKTWDSGSSVPDHGDGRRCCGRPGPEDWLKKPQLS